MAKTHPTLKLVSPMPPESPLDALLSVLFSFGEGELEELRRRLNRVLDRLAAGG